MESAQNEPFIHSSVDRSASAEQLARPAPEASLLSPSATPIPQEEFCFTPFESSQLQITCEFVYLVVSLVVAVGLTVAVTCFVVGTTRPLLLAALGGFLGGWTFDAKWFYKVTARGRDNQHQHKWQKHKFYWRILIPFVAGLIAFAAYMLASSESMPIQVNNAQSGRIAFGFTFFMGLFMDIVMSRITRWVETM